MDQIQREKIAAKLKKIKALAEQVTTYTPGNTAAGRSVVVTAQRLKRQK